MPKGYKKDGSISGKPFQKGQIAWNKGVPFSEESKKKMSLAHTLKPQSYWLGKKRPDMSKMFSELNRKTKGANHWNWRGGINPVNDTIRKSKRYKVWRKSVFERDDYTCQNCFVRGGKLNADHIKPFAFFEELRFDVNNGRTLCMSCHQATETYGRRAYKYVTANSFNEWMLLAKTQQT